MSGIRSMLKEAQEAIDSGNRVRAKQVLKDLLTLDPNNADAWYLASLVSKDEEAAIYALKRALKVNPKHAKAFSALTRRLTQQPEQHSIPPREGDIRLKTTTPTLDQRVPSSVSNADLRETSVAISSSNRPNKKVIRRFGLTATILIFIVIMSIFYHAYTTVLLPTQTPNIETQVAAVFTADARGTLDAIASFTLTPTLNLPRTAGVFANQTRTAIVIASFTKTPTPTPTFTKTLTPTPTPVWVPVSNDFNGVSMVLVPVGCFMMGSNDGESDERPVHAACLDQSFWIDQTEVTQAQFEKLGGKAARVPYFMGDNRPVEQITWSEALDFCTLRGARLPTEAEWEYAAKGPDGLIYPWGNVFNRNNAVFSYNSSDQTANVGSRPSGVSWVGALDMSGNVWEWVADWYGETYYADSPKNAPQGPSSGTSRVLRGGSWKFDVYELRSASRSWSPPDGRGNSVGFRCARSNNTTEASPVVSTPALPKMLSTPTAIPSETSNTVWAPVERNFDGVTMLLVPAGCFRMGTPSDEVAALNKQYNTDNFDDQKPVHEICFDQPFWIDQTEVTQAQFRGLGGKASSASYFTSNSRPVEQITWFEARDFCVVRGARLPTEAEWEYAARGPEGLTYPWGNTFVADNVVYDGNSNSQTANVGSRHTGVSWVGALDMSGNVWEWVNSLYQPYPYKADDGRESISDTNSDRVLRGGSWIFNASVLRAAYRAGISPVKGNNFIGFRCARSDDSVGTADGGMSMTDAAKQFLEAIFKSDKDKMRAVVCSAYKGAAEALLAAGGIPAGADVDLSGMTFTVAKENGDIGEVAVRGKIKVSFEGMSQEIDLAEMGPMSNLPMKNENGWKVCPYIP